MEEKKRKKGLKGRNKNKERIIQEEKRKKERMEET